MFTAETYVARRAKLCEKVGQGLMLFIGNIDIACNYKDNTYHFRQDSTFLYLFGLKVAGIAATLDAETGEAILYMDELTMDDIIWMGNQPSVSDQAATVGVTKVMPVSKLASVVEANKGREIHYVPTYHGVTTIRIAELLGKTTKEVENGASVKLIKALVSMREIKEQCEIEELRKHMAVGREMHMAAMTMAHAGRTEAEIMAMVGRMSQRYGGPVSFPIICTVHGETLHNHGYPNTLKNGQLLLVDAGSESPMCYATDHTRTSPVGGKFTAQQREIYQIVLDANNAVAATCEPGITYKEVHLMACRVIASGLKELGLMKGDVDEAVMEGAHALFMPHGIGHMLGLDVHDMESYNEVLVGYDDEIQKSTQFGLASLRLGKRLKEGFVVTDEPGIYFIPALIDKWKSEGICKDFINFDALDAYRTFGGIRLEDDLLITRHGCENLGERIPIEPEEVETEVNKNRFNNF